MGLKRFYQKGLLEAGCDEAGRGCLAGPVFAAAVILDDKKPIRGLDDSKKLNERQRNELRLEIEARALSYGVAQLSNKDIDKYNILKASFMAMHAALDKLITEPVLLLIDGNRFAAASILAKTYRDEFMQNAHQQYPQYSWDKNMGYPTKAHREAIKQFGATSLHRMTFTLLNDQITLDLK